MSLRAERRNLKQSRGIGIAFRGTRDNEKSMPLLMVGLPSETRSNPNPAITDIHKDIGKKGNREGKLRNPR